jgi:hypothetical protein
MVSGRIKTMKKYLHETSHRWISLALMIGLPFVGYIWLTPPASIVLSLILITIVHWINETYQKNSPKQVAKHGSWKAFLKESKKDWKHCIQGLGMGLIVTAIYWVVK